MKVVLVVAFVEKVVVEVTAVMTEKVAVEVPVVTWSLPNADLSLSTFLEYTRQYEL